MKKNSSKFFGRIIPVLILLVLASCASRKDVVYFQDTGNFETLVNDNTSVSKFKVDDLISICYFKYITRPK